MVYGIELNMVSRSALQEHRGTWYSKDKLRCNIADKLVFRVSGDVVDSGYVTKITPPKTNTVDWTKPTDGWWRYDYE